MADAAILADAPGRVNLIGEHTDYNGGFVLPTAIPQRTHVRLTPRADRTIAVASQDLGRQDSYELGAERPRHTWLDYVQGVTYALRTAGYALGGFDATIESDVPVGSGLSSSAALEVALLRAIRQAFHLNTLDDVQLALLGQRAENELVGARVGVMDQMASSLADARTALFLDTRDLTFERIPLPLDAADLVVIHSGVTHGHAGGEYNARRAACEQACQLLGVPQLRDLTLADLPRLAQLPSPLDRRARHVVTENARVLDAVAALRARDLPRFGALMNASHASLRDDYEVSTPELDLLVALAQADPAVFGARLTGGGFGGAVVLFTHPIQGRPVAERLASAYAAQSGRTPTVLVPPT